MSPPRCIINRDIIFNEEKMVAKFHSDKNKQVSQVLDVQFEVESSSKSNSNDTNQMNLVKMQANI